MTQTPIAKRRLSVDGDPGRTVMITIYVPRLDPDPALDWRCDFEIRGAVDESEHGNGIDSLQALVNAIQGVRKYLDDSGLVLTWNGAEPGQHWVPYTVPQFFDLAFEREIIEEIDRRIAALGPKLTLRSLDALMQRIDEGAPYDELVETLNAIASSASVTDPQVVEALQQARSMLDAARPPAKP